MGKDKDMGRACDLLQSYLYCQQKKSNTGSKER